MWLFAKERHPLPSRVVLSCLMFIGPAAFSAHLANTIYAVLSVPTLFGIATVFSFYFILRLSDELKDIDLDRVIFPERPIPSGRISPKDLRQGLAILFLLTPLFNIGSKHAFIAALVVVGYQVLMYRFFFIGNFLRRSPIINLVLHSPVFALIPAYSIFAAAGSMPASDRVLPLFDTALFVCMLWAPFCAWEVGRKLRPSALSDPYDIYSPVFGRLGALLCIALAQGFSTVIAWYLTVQWPLHWYYGILITLAYALSLGALLMFWLHPHRLFLNLRPFAEIFIGVVLVVQPFAFGLIL